MSEEKVKMGDSAGPKKTEVHHVFIMDESGSMGAIKTGYLNGINEQLKSIAEDQETSRKLNLRVTFVLYGSDVKIKEIDVSAKPLVLFDDQSYSPNGAKALYDAIVLTIQHMQKTCLSSNVVINIIAGGEDTCSQFHNAQDAKKHVELAKKAGWVVSLVGGSMDVEKMLGVLGISACDSIHYTFSLNAVNEMFPKMTIARKMYQVGVSPTGKTHNEPYYSDDKELTLV